VNKSAGVCRWQFVPPTCRVLPELQPQRWPVAAVIAAGTSFGLSDSRKTNRLHCTGNEGSVQGEDSSEYREWLGSLAQWAVGPIIGLTDNSVPAATVELAPTSALAVGAAIGAGGDADANARNKAM